MARLKKNSARCNACSPPYVFDAENTSIDPLLAAIWHARAQHPEEVAAAKAECEAADAEGREPKRFVKTGA